MDYKEFVDLVERMRTNQKAYFKGRDRYILEASKASEKMVDELLNSTDFLRDHATKELSIFVGFLRAAQRAYFASKDPSMITNCKNYEREVDKQIKDYYNNQGELF